MYYCTNLFLIAGYISYCSPNLAIYGEYKEEQLTTVAVLQYFDNAFAIRTKDQF